MRCGQFGEIERRMGEILGVQRLCLVQFRNEMLGRVLGSDCIIQQNDGECPVMRSAVFAVRHMQFGGL